MTKLTKAEKITFMQIPQNAELMKISLQTNSKVAVESYKTIDKPIKEVKEPNCNVGVLTGQRNQITVVDLDFKDIVEDDHIFIQKYGEKFQKFFNTFTVRTPSNGYHLYFKYDPEIKQTQNKDVGIDIRNDGGYVVCPPSSINGKAYTVVNDVKLKPIPDEFKEWLMSILYIKQKKEKVKVEKVKVDVPVLTTYDVKMTSDIMKDILGKLKVDCAKSKDFRGAYQLWIQVLRACKFCGLKTEFDEWSKGTIHENYDKEQNNMMWIKADATISNFTYILKCAKVSNTYSFKRIPENNFTGCKEINKAKLGNFFEPRTSYLVKSDTGTGKTTSFRKYIKRQQSPFISITSRIALSYEQYNDLKEADIDVHHYSKNEFEFGDSFIITPESSVKIDKYDFSNYIIFMDEFDSIIKHVLTSDTLVKSRKQVFQCLVRMIATCKQFICVDADVSSISKGFLDCIVKHTTKSFEFYVNIFKNYSGTKVKIINDEDSFFHLLSQKDKYLLCSDSKTSAEISHLKMKANDDDVLIVTSDSEQNYYNLDDYDKVIYSPKIIYGLDSTMKRDVFCYFNGLTISPSQMVQQIARCRNIINVYVFFPNRISKVPRFDELDEVREHFTKLTNCYNMDIERAIKAMKMTPEEWDDKILKGEDIHKLFNDLFYQNEYVNDCYNTNKYLHLVNILSNRGFVIQDEDGETKAGKHKEEKKKIMDEKLENFDPESSNVKRINEYLKIPGDKMDEYKELFVDMKLRHWHTNVSRFFFQDSNKNILEFGKQLDYDVSKCTNDRIKLKLLEEMLKTLNLDKDKLQDFEPQKKKIDNTEQIQERYTKMFRIRKKNFDMSIDTNMYKEICSMYSSMFGSLVSYKLKKFGKISIYLYTVDEEKLKYHRTVYQYRKKGNKVTRSKLV